MTAPGLLGTRQETLRAIYADVLGVPEVGADDGFFDAGGDSVLAVQVVARAREAGLALSVRDVFDHQTVAALAAVAREVPAEAPAPLAPLVALDAGQLAEFEDDEDEDEDDENPDAAGAAPAATGWETDR